MPKILFYTDTPIYGGAERHMHLLAKNLQKKGWEIKMVCSNYPSLAKWREKIKQDGLEVIPVKVAHKHDPRNYFQLKKIFKKEQPDLVHLHLWNPGACRYAFYALPSQTKLIVTEHDPFPLNGFKKSFKQKTFKKIDCIIAVSEDNKQKITEWYPEVKNKVYVVHNGIDIHQFEQHLYHFSAQERTKIRFHYFAAQKEDFIIVSIAALHPRKGLLYLLETLPDIQKIKPDFKLILVGEGPQKNELMKKIKDLHLEEKVKFLNSRRDEEIPLILKGSDLFVLPSIKEAFGLAVVEAMAAEIPVVASETGGIPEIIEHKKSGLLVEPENPEELKEAILELIKNKALRQKIALFGYHRAKEFDVEKMVEKTEEVYRRILDEKEVQPAHPNPPPTQGDNTKLE